MNDVRRGIHLVVKKMRLRTDHMTYMDGMELFLMIFLISYGEDEFI